MEFAVFTDGASNLPGRLLRELKIQVLPCTYMVDGVPVRYNGDVENFDAKAYYDGLREGKKITTSLINSQQFLDSFRPVLKKGQDIVYVGLSSGISGTIQAAKIAAEELRDVFPERVIRVVDSMGAGLGTGLLACRGADLRAEGLDANAAADRLEQEVPHLCEYFTVESLHFLHRSGRINAATAALGSVLNIKPLLYGNPEGHIVACGKYRGRKKAVDAIVERYEKKAVDPRNQRVFISHGDCREEAEALAERVRRIAEPKELIICPHEPFSGAHVGPGMLALFFLGDCR